jgi:phage head maturation protease
MAGAASGAERIPFMQYFVVMIDYGRRGREAIVDPGITRREVVSRVASGEYKNISFIHEVADGAVEDITADILAEAALPEITLTEIPDTGADLQADRFDHARDLRKHESV